MCACTKDVPGQLAACMTSTSKYPMCARTTGVLRHHSTCIVSPLEHPLCVPGLHVFQGSILHVLFHL